MATVLILKIFIQNARWLCGSLIVMALASGVQAQSAAASLPGGTWRQPPTSDFLVLSNVSGTVRVLDAQGLVLEKNLTYLPRIPLTDLSLAELQSLLETKTAYASLTSFGPTQGTNAQDSVMEHELQQSWRSGQSLAQKIQTRLEILADLREYNYNVSFLPGSVAVASQYEAQAVTVNDQLTNRAATAVTAAAQVEATELNRAGDPVAQAAEQQAQENYRELAVRAARASDRANNANGELASANQQVVDYLANCAAISARLATHGINVPSAAPFYLIPPLTLQTEVDADRKAN